MATIKKITVDELSEDMVVLRFDKTGAPYTFYAQPIPYSAVSETRKLLKNHGIAFVFIRENTPADEEIPVPAKNFSPYAEKLKAHIESPKPVAKAYASLEDILKAQQIHTNAKQAAKDILSEVRLGKAVNTPSAKKVVETLVTSCLQNPDAFVNMTRLKDFDDYTFTHSVNVSVLAIAIGKRLGLNAHELENLGLAGLLHDVGKMKVPDEILNKPGKLTDDEFAIMKQHPVYGYEVMKNDTSISPEVIKAALQHHEKSDGSGYPSGIQEQDISKYAKIIAICDVYDAITSNRCYHKGMIAADALKMLFAWSGKHFNEVLVKFFIHLIGVYPAGAVVVLDTGELAVVLKTNKDDGMRPKVLVISDNNKTLIPEPQYCDLTSYNTTTGIPYKSILAPVKQHTAAIDANKIIADFLEKNEGAIVS